LRWWYWSGWLDGASFTACNTGTQSYSSLSGGPAADGVSHTFNVHAVDSLAAPTLNRSYTWTVDTVAPTGVTATTCAATGNSNNRQFNAGSGISSVSGMTAGNTYAATSAAFNFSHSIYSSFQCFLDANTAAACANGKTFTTLTDGSHTVTARALDADSAATTNGTLTWTVKNAAPTLTAQPGGAGNAATDSSTVTVKLFAGTNTAGTPLQTYTPSRTGSTWTITGANSPKLTVGSPYTIQASQSDTVGNTTVGTTVCTFTA